MSKMKRKSKYIVILSIFSVLILSVFVSAIPSDLEKIEFIHYKDKSVKIEKPGKPSANTCYKLMGVRWANFPVSYSINPNNTQGLSESFITSAISTSAETWDAATTSKDLFNNIYSIDSSAEYGVQDFKNSIVFGDYSNTGVIAVTSVWFNRRTKQIVEFDMLFNTDYIWGNVDTTPGVMDLQNIATHELGHAVGLNDIYTTTCNQVTMYGYSNYGDTIKRDLESADIKGLQSMYGP